MPPSPSILVPIIPTPSVTSLLYKIINISTQYRLCPQIYENKHSFNLKVTDLRHQKVELVETMKKIGERLAEIRVEIPPKKARLPPAIPQIDDELEFPEKHLEVCSLLV